jgi:hypothetical protein
VEDYTAQSPRCGLVHQPTVCAGVISRHVVSERLNALKQALVHMDHLLAVRCAKEVSPVLVEQISHHGCMPRP